MSSAQGNEVAGSLRETFPGLDLGPRTEPLFDYGKLHQSGTPYNVFFPRNVKEVQEVVNRCRNLRMPIRVRASGHTFNGITLPKTGELLLRPDKLNQFSFAQEGTVDAGAGALMWDVRDLMRDFGFDLPVYNGGWAGPTLGGFISAGGFGKSGLSEVYGGLWENVERITLVDGSGAIISIDRSDRRFPWIFGSYGQFGLIVEARLRLIPMQNSNHRNYPLGSRGAIPRRQNDDPRENDLPPKSIERRLFWFSLLVSPQQEGKAWGDLARFIRRFPEEVVPEGGWAGPIFDERPLGYFYRISYLNFNPPLVFADPETFFVIGVMTRLTIGESDSVRRILEIEKAFIELAERGRYRLYLQAENIGRTVSLEKYYGPSIFEQFKALKQKFDPDGMFNPGLIEVK